MFTIKLEIPRKKLESSVLDAEVIEYEEDSESDDERESDDEVVTESPAE